MMKFREFVKLKPKQQVDLSKRKDASNIKLQSVPSDEHAVSQLTPSPTTTSSDDSCASDSNQDQSH